MTGTMTPVRLPEGGRAALSFKYDKSWEKTQDTAFRQGSRANILRMWGQLPQWVRRDPGFECLMDCYCPVNFEELELRRLVREQQVVEHVRGLLGNRFDPRAPVSDDEVAAAIRALPDQHAVMDFGINFGGGTVILTNSTTRTVVGAQCAANQAIRVWGLDIGFDGTTSTVAPGICELDTNTWATNAPGTNSTTVTPKPNDSGRPETIQTTCGKAWTTEPTVLTVVETFFIPNYMGSGIVFAPLTKPFVAKGGNGLSLRITQASGATANATGTEKCEE